MGEHRVLSWDWRGQPDLDDLAKAVRDLSGGKLRITQIDTGSDQYAIAISTVPLTPAEAYRAWEESWT